MTGMRTYKIITNNESNSFTGGKSKIKGIRTGQLLLSYLNNVIRNQADNLYRKIWKRRNGANTAILAKMKCFKHLLYVLYILCALKTLYYGKISIWN